MVDRIPLVSVCIPTRDRARWLSEALASVFEQTLQDFEVVVFDDASRDATQEVVADWSDSRLRYLRQPRPVGVARNRNSCLAVARGRYIAWLDSDDRYHPHMLAVQSAALDRHPEAALAHGGFEVIDTDGQRLPDWPQPFSVDVVESGLEAFEELVLDNYVVAPTVLARRAVYDAVGPYATSLASGEDWEMWLRIALHADVAYSATPVAQYRWHPGSLSRSAESSGLQLSRDLRVLSRIFGRFGARIPRLQSIQARAHSALAVRALFHATDRVTRRDRLGALCSLLLGVRARPTLSRERAAWRLLSSVVRRDEYGWHVQSRALLQTLTGELEGSRLADRLRRRLTPAPGWEATLRRIARTVRELVPPGTSVAVVDKWDPTVLHLAARRGWHFPDRRAMPDGYPPDSTVAVRHLEDLRARGARYLVFPCSAFWWLEHYQGLAQHLQSSAERIWDDDRCVIYRLTDSGSSCAA